MKGKPQSGFHWWEELLPLKSPFQEVGANEPVILFEDQLDFKLTPSIFEIEQKSHFVSSGTLYLEWLPKLSYCFDVVSESYALIENVELRKRGITAKAKTIHYSIPVGSGEARQIKGAFTEDIVWGEGSKKQTKYMVFHLANFLSHGGHAIHTDTDNFGIQWRWILETKDWRIAIDTLGKADFASLKETRGFQLTHVGRLEKTDGRRFSANEATNILNALGYFISFLRGAWSSPILFTGYSQIGQEIWGLYHRPFLLSPYQNEKSWMIWDDPNYVSHAWPSFWQKWETSGWRETLRICIAWHIEATNATFGENALLLTQAALERMAWQVIAIDGNYSNKEQKEFLDKKASDRIRALLDTLGIKPSVPSVLSSLYRYSKRKNWTDGAQAFTELRNGIVHPQHWKRLLESPDKSIKDVIRLGMSWLDIALLKHIGFHGLYRNRVTRRNEEIV